MELTKRQEKQLNKVFDDPKKLRKWFDDVYKDMIVKCENKSREIVEQYLDIYSITVAYTLHYACGFGKKRLPKIMERIWNNIDCFKDGYLHLDDCIEELEKNGIIFDSICKGKNLFKEKKKNDNKQG